MKKQTGFGLMFVLAIALSCPKIYGQTIDERIEAARQRVAENRCRRVAREEAEIAERRCRRVAREEAEIAERRCCDTNARIANLEAETAELQKQLAAAAKKQAVNGSNESEPRCPRKEVVAHPAATELVNILLIDEYDRVHLCLKRVRVSDVTQNGKHFHFQVDGNPNDWNQKVLFSYSYADNEAPITGAIYYTPEIAGAAAKAVNVPPRNVYQDTDGSIRYDDGCGNYPRAPKGSGYVTAQCVLPTQP